MTSADGALERAAAPVQKLPAAPDESRGGCARPAEARHRPVPLRRRLSGDALPPRRALAAQRARLAAKLDAHLERLRRLDHRRRARARLERARLRRAAIARRTSTPRSSSRSAGSRRRRSTSRRSSAGRCCPGRSGTGSRAPTTEHLFGKTTLQELPGRAALRLQRDEPPVRRARARFSKPYMGDYRVGEVREPEVRVAVAVAASSAIPAVPLPRRAEFDDGAFVPGSGSDLETAEYQRSSSSPTAASTTTSGWRQPGSATRRCWSATAAARCGPKPKPRARLAAAAPARHRRRSTTRCGACASAR